MGEYALFWRITLPLLKPSLTFALVMATIWNMQVFDWVYGLTKGGPGYSTTTVVYYIYNQAFSLDSMGRAATGSFVLLVLIIGLALVSMRALRSDYEY